MDEETTKICSNCKRDIPEVNFLVHTVHCARNIKMCPVCKEPVPQADLQEHYDIMHELKPCSKCGERVCGSDLEDHIRDSCAHTVRPCRYCTLELPRRELPLHEGYCGARTERCEECGQFVMVKYRGLHEESNHGFIKLDDDPTPPPKFVPLKFPKSPIHQIPNPPIQQIPNPPIHQFPNPPTVPQPVASNTAPRTDNRVLNRNVNGIGPNGDGRPTNIGNSSNSSSKPQNGEGDGSSGRPGPSGAVPKKNGLQKSRAKSGHTSKGKNPTSQGTTKRQAPKPPPNPIRDLSYYSASQRCQEEERLRREQTAFNLAQGLPPVLSPLAKLEKLRKMDALHNRETPVDYKHKLQGRCWTDGMNRDQLQGLKPMSQEQFLNRVQALQLTEDVPEARPNRPDPGRFSAIKNSLRELRRGLNEVTAPYNTNIQNSTPRPTTRNTNDFESFDEAVLIPCEFCSTLVDADDLVLHQTGCRPDLARLHRAASVIPCEFCMQPLPAHLITEHQERCSRESPAMYPD